MSDLNIILPVQSVNLLQSSLSHKESDDLLKSNPSVDIIHIRIYQRKSRKYITTIEGLPNDLDLKKIIKVMKKSYSCNGVVKKSGKDDGKQIISLTGDQREKVKSYLISQGIVEEKQIKVHGF